MGTAQTDTESDNRFYTGIVYIPHTSLTNVHASKTPFDSIHSILHTALPPPNHPPELTQI